MIKNRLIKNVIHLCELMYIFRKALKCREKDCKNPIVAAMMNYLIFDIEIGFIIGKNIMWKN